MKESKVVLAPAEGFEAVKDHLPEEIRGWTRSILALGIAYNLLARYSAELEGVRSRDLRRLYDPDVISQPVYGKFIDRDDWWQTIGKEALRQLPGVENEDEFWFYSGVKPDDFTKTIDSRKLPVGDEVVAEKIIIETDFRLSGARADRQREALLFLWKFIQESRKPVSEEKIIEQLKNHNIGRVDRFWQNTAQDALQRFPGITRQEESTGHDPSKMEVETLQDVLDGLEKVDVLNIRNLNFEGKKTTFNWTHDSDVRE